MSKKEKLPSAVKNVQGLTIRHSPPGKSGYQVYNGKNLISESSYRTVEIAETVAKIELKQLYVGVKVLHVNHGERASVICKAINDDGYINKTDLIIIDNPDKPFTIIADGIKYEQKPEKKYTGYVIKPLHENSIDDIVREFVLVQKRESKLSRSGREKAEKEFYYNFKQIGI